MSALAGGSLVEILTLALQVVAGPGGQEVLQRLLQKPDVSLDDLKAAAASRPRPTPPPQEG